MGFFIYLGEKLPLGVKELSKKAPYVLSLLKKDLERMSRRYAIKELDRIITPKKSK